MFAFIQWGKCSSHWLVFAQNNNSFLHDLGSVENESRKNCKQQNQNLIHRLPKLPTSGAGGDTDNLIGSKYNRYFPKPIFKLETGLEIYESVFVSPCGSRGVVSGPHKDFSETEKDFKGTSWKSSVHGWDIRTCY